METLYIFIFICPVELSRENLEEAAASLQVGGCIVFRWTWLPFCGSLVVSTAISYSTFSPARCGMFCTALSLSLSVCFSKHSAALVCCISFIQNGVKNIIIIIGLYDISLVRSANKGLKQGAVKKGSNTLLF
jgi:hypothetical protein